jgi:hypothetical protein
MTHQLFGHAGPLLRAMEHAPRNAIRLDNLKWELFIAAVTGVLIAQGDQPATNRIQGRSIQHLARLWSNVGLGTEIGTGFATWGVGCIQREHSLRNNGLTALTAMGGAGALESTLLSNLPLIANFLTRQAATAIFGAEAGRFPQVAPLPGRFAAAIAHRYPHNPWLKWGAYGLATASGVIALSRQETLSLGHTRWPKVGIHHPEFTSPNIK